MGLLRLLLAAALIMLAIWAWRRFISPRQKSQQTTDDSPKPMVRCAQCGVHVPLSNALSDNQQWYCSSAHREQGPK